MALEEEIQKRIKELEEEDKQKREEQWQAFIASTKAQKKLNLECRHYKKVKKN